MQHDIFQQVKLHFEAFYSPLLFLKFFNLKKTWSVPDVFVSVCKVLKDGRMEKRMNCGKSF